MCKGNYAAKAGRFTRKKTFLHSVKEHGSRHYWLVMARIWPTIRRKYHYTYGLRFLKAPSPACLRHLQPAFRRGTGRTVPEIRVLRSGGRPPGEIRSRARSGDRGPAARPGGNGLWIVTADP